MYNYSESVNPCSPSRPHRRLLVSSTWAALASMEDGSNEFSCCDDTEIGADDGGTGAGIGGGGGGTGPPEATT